jgi:hypothetical protein
MLSEGVGYIWLRALTRIGRFGQTGVESCVMGETKVEITGIAWYRQQDYQRLLEMFEDGHRLPATYEEWLQKADSLFKGMKNRGVAVQRVYLYPDDFAAWCRSRGLNINASARMKYAAAFVAGKHLDKS